MWDLRSPWSLADWGPPIPEKDASCAPLCQHPPCWQSNMRKVKGIKDLPPEIPPKEEIETDLPTLKVCNMLDDYGDDPRDLYPAKFAGKPQHVRSSVNIMHVPKSRKPSSLKVPSPPTQTPVSEKKVKSAPKGKPIQLVEVQEMFELEDLNKAWDDNFLPKKFYVWVPNPRRKQRQEQAASISELAKSGPQKVLVRDMTEDMIPRHIEYEQTTKPYDGPVIKMRRRLNSPASSRYRTPYSRSSAGQRAGPHFYGGSGIEELLDLPRDILVRVLDHAKQSDFASSQKLHELISKFVPIMDREPTDMTANSTDLLQQKKMNIYEGKEKKHNESHLMETKPVYYLDEDGVEQEVFPEPRMSRGHRLNDSDYGSYRDLYMSGTREFPKLKKPLPPIGGIVDDKVKIPSISLGLPQLPSGVQQTRTFNYSRRNYRNLDLTIAPVPTPPTSYRTEDTSGSDHGTTVHVNIPSAESVRDGVPQSAAEQAELAFQVSKKLRYRMWSSFHDASSKSERSAPRTPLHAVSPAQSTRVPQAPATTPATHGQMSPMKLYRDQSGLSTGSHKKATTPSRQNHSRENTRSPNAEIRAPTNSPRALTPEQTGKFRRLPGLGTIEETGHEEGEGPHPVSRGGRSVRFAEEVPEIPPPPSSPQNPDDPEESTPGVEQQREGPSFPASRQTGFTNQPTFNTMEKELSQDEIQIKSAKKRDSLLSTPEPWPQVNEADYDVTPAHTKMTLHGSNESKVNDSRLAHMDPYSDRSVGTGSTIRADITSRDSTRSYMTQKEESPGPPPPSPEPKDRNDEPRSARKRDSKSRESTTMTPLLEEKDEDAASPDVHIRTLIIEVPPLGQREPKEKSKGKTRTTDTFVSIDIPAQQAAEGETTNGKRQLISKGGRRLEPPLEEREEDSTVDGETINTREQNLSVQSSVAGRTTADGDTETDVGSAGVDPSIGGNVSPTSTITGNERVANTDLRQFIEHQEAETEKIEEDNEPKSSERRKDSSEMLGSRDSHMPDGEDQNTEERGREQEPQGDRRETEGAETEEDGGPEGNVTQRSEQEITEFGGDNDAFKSLLAEELARINQQD
ncbi:uncharacterized protein LOC128193062 isoform X9 [Crassostrea angulata]|uniref:uncharacterized protein LOC128193062 isoform X9 n=1 Tax=Magallana angulata TaxID=2784310 RepID=UPI0022B1B127|nr:uncharacterized protein LOC128193062 isoform X9 [Crassostrea angulata]